LKVLHSTGYWLKGANQVLFLWLSAANILIFRSELSIICGLMLLISLIKGRIGLIKTILHGLLSLIVFIGLSFVIDSYFWKKNVWPEGNFCLGL
jgi:hypothetical protein